MMLSPLPATLPLRPPLAETRVVGGRRTLFVRGHRTAYAGESEGNSWDTTLLAWGKTPGGLVYGTVRVPHHGAYTATSSTAFVMGGDWIVERHGFEIEGVAGERALFMPVQFGSYWEATEAYLYDKGELTSIGHAYAAHLERNGRVTGHYDSNEAGDPVERNDSWDSGQKTYRRYFEWKDGVRTITGRRQIGPDIPDRGGQPVPDPEEGVPRPFPIPERKSFLSFPSYEATLGPTVTRSVRREGDRWRLVVAGKGTGITGPMREYGPYLRSTVGRTGVLYGDVSFSSREANGVVAFVGSARGVRGFPDFSAAMERDGRVLLLSGPPRSPFEHPAGEARLVVGGEVFDVGPARGAEIARDGSVVGWLYVRADGTPFPGEPSPGRDAVFVQEFVWRHGVRTLGARRAL